MTFWTAPEPAFVTLTVYVSASPTVASAAFTVLAIVTFGAEAGMTTVLETALPDKFLPLGS
ncbi:hypothetical protein D1872_349740 [compost metagenome]